MSRGLRADGGPVPADTVPAIRPRIVTPPGRPAYPPDGSGSRRERTVVSDSRPIHRDQIHRRRRSRRGRRGAVADLRGIDARHDLRGCRAGSPADRVGGRSSVTDSDELRRELGPPRRLWDWFGDQRRGPSGRWRTRRRGGRKRDGDALPGPHDDRSCRPPRADRCHARHSRLSRRGPRRGACGRWCHGRTLGPRGARCVHERVGGVARASELSSPSGAPSSCSPFSRSVRPDQPAIPALSLDGWRACPPVGCGRPTATPLPLGAPPPPHLRTFDPDPEAVSPADSDAVARLDVRSPHGCSTETARSSSGRYWPG